MPKGARCKSGSLAASSRDRTRMRGRSCSCRAPYRREEGPKPLQRGLSHSHRGASQEGLIPRALEATALQFCPRRATWGCLAWTGQDCHGRDKSFQLPDRAQVQRYGYSHSGCSLLCVFSFKAPQKGFRLAPELSLRPSPWLHLLPQGKKQRVKKKK